MSRGLGCSPVVEHLTSMCEALGSISNTKKRKDNKRMSVEATFNKTPLRILALSVYTDFLQKLHYYKLLNTGNK
jgi:hypothetical protein